MRKLNYYLLAIIAWALCSHHLQAQVSIGSLNDPTGGTLIDLNGAQGGLLLSNVYLTSVEQIPADFVGFTKATNPFNLRGTIIYNTNTSIGAGVFVWNGSKWHRIVSPPCEPIGKPYITEGPWITATAGTQFTLTAEVKDTGRSARTITWYRKPSTSNTWEDKGSNSFSWPTVSSNYKPTESTPGTYFYYCELKSGCNPEDITRSEYIRVDVGCKGTAPEWQGAGVKLSSTILNTKAPADGYVTASITQDPNATSYTWKLPQGIVYELPSAAASDPKKHYEIRIKPSSTAKIYDEGTIQVTANNECRSSLPMVNHQPLKIYNCPGVIIAGGVHDSIPGKATTVRGDSLTYDGLVVGTGRLNIQKANKDLCLYYRDTQLGVVGNQIYCETAGSVDSEDKVLGGWRLPAPAELAQMALPLYETIPQWNQLESFKASHKSISDQRTTNLIIDNNPNYWFVGYKTDHYTTLLTFDFRLARTNMYLPFAGYNSRITARCVRTLN